MSSADEKLYDLRNAKTDEQMIEWDIENQNTKAENAAKREEERLNKPSITDKLYDGIIKLKKKLAHKKSKDAKAAAQAKNQAQR